MFRAVAALLAKKTAIVAITGVTVIGGATFALAQDGDETPEQIQTEATDETTTTTTESTTTTTEQQDDAAPEDGGELELESGSQTDGAVGGGLTAEEEGAEDNGDDAARDDDPVAEHPENHGKYVSEAAKGGGDCAGLTGRDKGQCVSGVARSDIGKKAAEEPTEPTEPTVIEEPAPVEQPAAAIAPAQPEKGKPAHAGPPAGKSNGKGKVPKG